MAEQGECYTDTVEPICYDIQAHLILIAKVSLCCDGYTLAATKLDSIDVNILVATIPIT